MIATSRFLVPRCVGTVCVGLRPNALGPDYLIRAWRATGHGKLPILWLDGRAIADSTRIIAALEERHPEPPLYPRDAGARQRALELEDDLDETLGPALRATIVTPLFRNDPDIALRVLTTGMPEKAATAHLGLSSPCRKHSSTGRRYLSVGRSRGAQSGDTRLF